MNDAVQSGSWNEEAGRRWVAMQRDLDAQLEPLGIVAMNALGLAAGERVLDVGCGAGATSLMLADRVRPGEVLGVDISAALLARARERATGIEHLAFAEGDAQTFAFAEGAFDALFSRFGVMFFADPVAAFRNLKRALRAGGRLAFVCWRAMNENPSFTLPIDAARPLLPEPETPPAPADPLAPGPFAFADDARLRSVLEAAGFGEIAITPHDSELVVAGRADLEGAVDLAFQVGPLSRALPEIDDAARARVRGAVRDAFAPHLRPAGVTLPAATWIVTARASLTR